MARKTHSAFLEEMKIKHPNIKIIGTYVINKIHIDVECLIDGYKWKPTPRDLSSGYGCPKCAGTMKKTTEIFKEEMKNSTIEILGEYINNRTPIHVKCKKCSHKWSPRPDSLSRGRRCPNCVGKCKTTTSFTVEMRKINKHIKIIGEYKNDRANIDCECLKCGRSWSPIVSDILRGHGCSNCIKGGFKHNKPSELYLYNIDNIYLGYGITGDSKQRHINHAFSLRNFNFKHTHSFYFKTGHNALTVESIIKKKFTRMDTGIEGFKTEATSMNNLDAVLLLIEREISKFQIAS